MHGKSVLDNLFGYDFLFVNSGVCKHSGKCVHKFRKRKIDERNSIVLVRKHGSAIETVDSFDFTQFVALLDKQGVFLDLVDEQLTLVFGIVLGDFLVLFWKSADGF